MIKGFSGVSVVLPMSNTLVLPNITMEDRGLYRCKAELLPQIHNNTTAKVSVFSEQTSIAVAECNIITQLWLSLNAAMAEFCLF